MGVSKSLNRLTMLGLLACASTWAQDVVTVKVGLSKPGAYYLVDGQPYTSTQSLQWTVGSTHEVYFVQSQEPDFTLGNHQYPTTILGSRYTFSSWTVAGQSALSSQPLLVITVDPTLTARTRGSKRRPTLTTFVVGAG